MKKINPAYFEFMFNYQNAQVDKFWFMPSLSVRELWDTWRLQNSIEQDKLKKQSYSLFVRPQDSQRSALVGQCKDLSLELPGSSVCVDEEFQPIRPTMQGLANILNVQPVATKDAESILFPLRVQKEQLSDKTA